MNLLSDQTLPHRPVSTFLRWAFNTDPARDFGFLDEIVGIVLLVVIGFVTIAGTRGATTNMWTETSFTSGSGTGTTLVTDGGRSLATTSSTWTSHGTGTSETLTDVAFVDTTQALAVGDNGIILQWNGSAWTAQTSGTTNTLWSVAAASPTLAWAVGDNGTILRWDGSAWTSVASGTTSHLFGVTARSASFALAVGDNGTILRWDGTTWAPQTSGTTNIVYAVDTVSDTLAWAVGSGGTILQWNGSAWTAQTSGTTNHLFALSALSSTQALAVGDNGIILQWNGSAWEARSSGTTDALLAAGFLGATDGWMSGEYGLLLGTTDGVTWSSASSGTTDGLFGMTDAGGSGRAWVVGSSGRALSLTTSFVSSGTYESATHDVGESATPISIAWNGTAPTGTTLQFQFASNTDNASWVFSGPDGTAGTFYTGPGGSLIGSQHTGHRYFRYRAFFVTTDASVSPTLSSVTVTSSIASPTPTTPPIAPILVSPTDGAVLATATPAFDWDDVVSALAYTIQIDDAADFSSPVYNARTTASFFPIIVDLSDGSYLWRVRATNEAGDGAWSSVRTLTVTTAPSTPPEPVVPPPPVTEEPSTVVVPEPTPTPEPTPVVVPPATPSPPITPEPPVVPPPSPTPTPAPVIPAEPVTPPVTEMVPASGSAVTPPITPSFVSLAITSPLVTGENPPVIAGNTGIPLAPLTLLVNNQAVATGTTDATGAFIVTLPIRLPDGTHEIALRINGVATPSTTMTIDTTPPDQPTVDAIVLGQQFTDDGRGMTARILVRVQTNGDGVDAIVGTSVNDASTSFALDEGRGEAVLSVTTSAGAIIDLRVTAGDRAANRSRAGIATVVLPTEPFSIACSDTMDNDGDGAVDYPTDPGCATLSDDTEDDSFLVLLAEQPTVRAVTDAVTDIARNVAETTQSAAAATVRQVVVFAEQTERAVAAAAPIAVPALVAAAPIAVAASPFAAGAIPAIPQMTAHGVSFLLSALGIRRKRSAPWGVVYDAITKEPVPLAILRLFDATTHRLIGTQVTDNQGRFSFLPPPGTYTIAVAKASYTFPSRIVTGSSDAEIADLYHGGAPFTIAEDQHVRVNIPLDPPDPRVTHVQEIRRVAGTVRHVMHALSLPVLVFGLSLAVIIYAFTQTPVNLTIIVGYLLFAVFEISVLPKTIKSWGVVFDAQTRAPVPLAAVSIVEPTFKRVIKTRLSDYHGRFSFLPDPGTYELRVTKPAYTFPSTTEMHDRKHPALYRGGTMTISKKNGIVAMDIPLDPAPVVPPVAPGTARMTPVP